MTKVTESVSVLIIYYYFEALSKNCPEINIIFGLKNFTALKLHVGVHS